MILLLSWWLPLFNYSLVFCGERGKNREKETCVFVWSPKSLEHGESRATQGLCVPLRVTHCLKEDSQHMHMFLLFTFLFICLFFNGTSYCNLVNSHLKSRHHPVALKSMIFIFTTTIRPINRKIQSKPLHLFFFCNFICFFAFLKL